MTIHVCHADNRTRQHRCGRLLAGLAAICLAAPVGAQPTAARNGLPTDDRPRIGLVLSGGGARGGLHVGVLRALEELRIPIDYIAGTSIGAVIGGFYASGLTADQIEDVINSINWDAAFLEDTPRALRSFRRKREDDLFLVDQRPGLNDGQFDFPLGVVQGQIIDLITSETVLSASRVRSFDDLPIPFRAVAADIATGEAVVLGSGNLASALRATMSVPAIIAPIEIDGRLLVDGGVAMNLPIEVARDMGADIVIAVDVTSPLLERAELNTVLDVTAQLTTLLTRYGVEAQLETLTSSDVLLTAEVDEEFGSTTFSTMAAMIPLGYTLAMDNAARLQPLAVEPGAYVAHRSAQLDAKPEPPTRIDFVRLENNSTVEDGIVEWYFEEIEASSTLDVALLERTINRIYGLGFFQNVRYALVEDGESTGLEIRVDERSWGPGYAQAGLQFNASGNQDLLFGVAGSYLRTGLNPSNGEIRATAVLGAQPAAFFDLHQPFGAAGRYFVAPAIGVDSTLLNFFDGETRVTEARVKASTLELGLGRELGSWGEFRAGFRRRSGSVDVEIGQPGLIDEGSFHAGHFFARLAADTLDNVAFPRSGVAALLEWRSSDSDKLSADAEFDQVSLSASVAKTWDRYTLLSTLRYETTFDGVAPITSQYRFGGLFDLSGLGRRTVSAQNVARIGASFYRRINDLALLPAFVGFSLEYGNTWESRSAISFDDALLGGSLWLGLDTPIGPIYGGYGRTEEGSSSFYLVLGRIF
jgi:NTE family protein